jgi:hypothetical protein
MTPGAAAAFEANGDDPLAFLIKHVCLDPGGLDAHDIRENQLGVEQGRRFGFHNLRHSLASFLVSVGTNPKIVQGLLRHSDVHTTLQLHSQSVSADSARRGSGHNARCDGCSTGVGKLKNELRTGYGKN